MIEFDNLHRYKINIALNPHNRPYGTFGGFEDYDGRVFDIEDFNEIDHQAVCIDYYWFSKDLFVPINKPEANIERIKKEDTRTYKDFKVGDLVKLRSFEDLTEHYKYGDQYVYTSPYSLNMETHQKLKNCRFEITAIYENGICDVITQMDKEETHIIDAFCTEMFEIVEEGYRDRIMKNSKMKIEKVEINEDEIIEEMISKVDVAKFKKIIASSFRTKATSLEGIDQLLINWARAKKDIYMIFGRNLVLRKPIEYEMNNEDIISNLEILKSKFPAFTQIFSFLDLSDIRHNKLCSAFCSNYKSVFPFIKTGMTTSTFVSRATTIERMESLKNLSDEEKETYLALKEKVKEINPVEIEYSKLFENCNVKGQLAMSIDPIDYLLMSTNKSGWNSCYALSKRW